MGQIFPNIGINRITFKANLSSMQDFSVSHMLKASMANDHNFQDQQRLDQTERRFARQATQSSWVPVAWRLGFVARMVALLEVL